MFVFFPMLEIESTHDSVQTLGGSIKSYQKKNNVSKVQAAEKKKERNKVFVLLTSWKYVPAGWRPRLSPGSAVN